MNKFFYTLMGGLLAATFATATFTTEAPALARKVGGYKSSLLHRQHMRYLHNGQV